jgi:hypothetical protein
VHSLELNAKASVACVYSARKCMVVQLPKAGLERSLAGKALAVKCKTFSVGHFFHSTSPSLVITQALWHPLSDVHLVILTSDNRLR